MDFQYAREWLDWHGTFPISLSLSLRDAISVPVINVFDNLLPDNEAIRKRVAEWVGAAATDAYSLLGIDPSISVENIGPLSCSRRSVFLPPRQRSPTSGNAAR